jgi:hypothetical protein
MERVRNGLVSTAILNWLVRIVAARANGCAAAYNHLVHYLSRALTLCLLSRQNFMWLFA